ncbi:hypothetical protein XENOCAPTIV_020615, partial [Xenoophorus captivus]
MLRKMAHFDNTQDKCHDLFFSSFPALGGGGRFFSVSRTPPISALLQLCVLSFWSLFLHIFQILQNMDLVSWSLNAIDQIFLTRRQGSGEPTCPDGTFFSGYTMDSWQKWRIVSLSIMSVKDVEDMYIIGCLISGFLLFGVSGYL